MADNQIPKPVSPPIAPTNQPSVSATASVQPTTTTPTTPVTPATANTIPYRSFSKPVPPGVQVGATQPQPVAPASASQTSFVPTPGITASPTPGGVRQPQVAHSPSPIGQPAPSPVASRPFGSPTTSSTAPKPFTVLAGQQAASQSPISVVKPGTSPVPPAPSGASAPKPSVGFTVPAAGGKLPPQTPGTPPKNTASASNRGAAPRKSIFRFFPILLVLLLILGAIGGAVYYFFGQKNENTAVTPGTSTTAKKTITYWGLWEPTTVMQEVLSDFEKQNPEYKVEYVQQSYKEYRERLQAEIAKGTGPDVFRFHASWVPMLKNELSPLPDKIMTQSEFSQTFYPVATQQLTYNNQIVGIPLMIDGLGLYYNKDIFSVANKTPPKNWEELKQTSQALTIRAGDKITRGGVAMGTTSNVEHFSEIVALLMLQNGADPANPTTPQAIEAINFYLDFGEKLKVWDTTLPNATVAFAKGDVAMMIAPSWRAHEIKQQNPNLQFDIVPVPQLPDKERTTWASFWAEGVSQQSKDKDGAWKLLKYLSSAEVEKKFYSEASKTRAFGELYSRKDLADEIANAQYVGAYIQDAPYAKAWYLNAYTHDNGINDQIIKYYEDALNKGIGALSESMKTVQQGMTQVLSQYGVVSNGQTR